MKNAFILIAAANPCGLQSRPGLPRSTNCSSGGFLGSAFGGCFNYRAQRIAEETGSLAPVLEGSLEAFASNFLLN